MATSYAANVVPYLQAMKKANPATKIGVPWAFNGAQAAGAGVKNASLWNAKVLRATKADVSFVDAHWYPFDQVAGVTDQQIVLSTRRIPAGGGRESVSTLHREAPGVAFLVGETNISERLTTLDFQPGVCALRRGHLPFMAVPGGRERRLVGPQQLRFTHRR